MERARHSPSHGEGAGLANMSDIKREWFDTDYYAILGVAKSADAAEITKAYRALARKLHPDANPGDPSAEDRFKEVSSAYDVLGDEDKRRQYDHARRLGPMAGGLGGQAGGPGGMGGNAGGWDFDGMGDLGDLLGSVMGGGLFGGGGQRPRSAPAKGADQEARLSIGFDEAIRGMTTEIQVNGRSGNRQIKIRVPAGVDDGQKIRLKGKGAPGAGGGPAGDLLVKLSIEPHEVFGRDGANLTIGVPVTFAEAALGAKITVPTFAGSTKTLRIPPGTHSGSKFRVKGEGVDTGKRVGDLIVSVEIHVPTELSDEARDQLKAFADLTEGSPRSYLGV